MKSNERKVADIAIERRAEHLVQASAHAGRHVWRRRRYSYGGGSNFFDWIFGGPQGGPRPYPPRNYHRRRRDNNGRYSWR